MATNEQEQGEEPRALTADEKAAIDKRDADNLAANYQHPRTKSTDGFLHGGHPELGDIIYRENGEEVGRVTFFYDRVKDHVWRVQAEGCAEDPLLVAVKPMFVEGIEIGHRLIALHGIATKIPNNNLGANVVITNNVLSSIAK